MRIKTIINGAHVIITEQMIKHDPDYPLIIPPEPKTPKILPGK